MRFALGMILALGLWAGSASAQDTYLAGSGLDMSGRMSGGGGSFGLGSAAPGAGGLLGNLFKSDRFHLSNETSFSVVSGAGGSLSQGLNVTRLTYSTPSSLQLSAGLGNVFMHGGSYYGYTAKPGFFLHDLSMSYKPSEHSLIQFQFSQAPGQGLNPYYVPGYGFDGLAQFPR